MQRTNSGHASPRYRNPLEFSFTAQEESRRDGLLRTAFVNIVQGFSCRPEPRNAWDEAATGDLTPWKKIVHPIRHALNAAVVSGDRELIEKTLEGARAFCRELEADFARPRFDSGRGRRCGDCAFTRPSMKARRTRWKRGSSLIRRRPMPTEQSSRWRDSGSTSVISSPSAGNSPVLGQLRWFK